MCCMRVRRDRFSSNWKHFGWNRASCAAGMVRTIAFHTLRSCHFSRCVSSQSVALVWISLKCWNFRHPTNVNRSCPKRWNVSSIMRMRIWSGHLTLNCSPITHLWDYLSPKTTPISWNESPYSMWKRCLRQVSEWEKAENFFGVRKLQFISHFASNSVISDTYEQLDALVACFPWCGGVTSNTRCIPRSSRCKCLASVRSSRQWN